MLLLFLLLFLFLNIVDILWVSNGLQSSEGVGNWDNPHTGRVGAARTDPPEHSIRIESLARQPLKHQIALQVPNLKPDLAPPRAHQIHHNISIDPDRHLHRLRPQTVPGCEVAAECAHNEVVLAQTQHIVIPAVAPGVRHGYLQAVGLDSLAPGAWAPRVEDYRGAKAGASAACEN